LRAYRDHTNFPVVSIRKNRYSTTFHTFFNILLVEIPQLALQKHRGGWRERGYLPVE